MSNYLKFDWRGLGGICDETQVKFEKQFWPEFNG